MVAPVDEYAGRCANCGKKKKERCPYGYCRACHVSLGFEECCDGSWIARQRAEAGLSVTT